MVSNAKILSEIAYRKDVFLSFNITLLHTLYYIKNLNRLYLLYFFFFLLRFGSFFLSGHSTYCNNTAAVYVIYGDGGRREHAIIKEKFFNDD